MSGQPHREHDPQDLCPAGAALYEQALREGRIRSEDTVAAPCLVDLGLLRPAPDDLSLLEPVPPAAALYEVLRASERRVASEWRRKERLTETLAELIRVEGSRTAVGESPAITVLSGMERINQVITGMMADATREVLSVQPRTADNSSRGKAEAVALERDQALLDRGGRIRALYQHTQRHSPLVIARYEQLRGDAEARTLDEVTGRMIIVDRTVAFIPANPDRTMALELRQPALVDHLATTFDRLWRLATPMYPEAAGRRPSQQGITTRQRAIAGLLVEGHTDAVIADRLGMNVRTVRVHIAKLAAALGSESRAQLGYLIGRSGILDQAG